LSIRTIFAHISCRDIGASLPWYENLFARPPLRKPTSKLAGWPFTDSAEVQLFEQPEHAGHTGLTIGALPLRPVHERLIAAGLEVGDIEQTGGYYTMRLRDPDGNLIVFAGARLD
jgi:hypothetical protein